MDSYEVLGVSRDATPEQIRAAYIRLAKKYHPDHYEGNPLADLAAEKMKEINQAYENIKNAKATNDDEETPGSTFTWDPYEVLGISPDASRYEIKLAFIQYGFHHKGNYKEVELGEMAYNYAMAHCPYEDDEDTEYDDSYDSVSYDQPSYTYTYRPHVTYRPREIFHALPIPDLLISTVFIGMMANLLFKIHPAFCILIGIGTGILLGLIFMTKVGNWILSIAYSLMWGGWAGALAFDASNKDPIWGWCIFGIITAISLLYHKTHTIVD